MRGDLEAKVALRGRCARELVQGDLAEGHVREDLGPNPAAGTLVMARKAIPRKEEMLRRETPMPPANAR